jgi:ATP-dependent Lon protease
LPLKNARRKCATAIICCKKTFEIDSVNSAEKPHLKAFAKAKLPKDQEDSEFGAIIGLYPRQLAFQIISGSPNIPSEANLHKKILKVNFLINFISSNKEPNG